MNGHNREDKRKARLAEAAKLTPPTDLAPWREAFLGWGFCYNELREKGLAACTEIDRLRKAEWERRERCFQAFMKAVPMMRCAAASLTRHTGIEPEGLTKLADELENFIIKKQF